MVSDSEKVLWEYVNKQPTIAKKKKLASTLGLKFKHPSVSSQIFNNGKVTNDFKRGRALNGRQMILIPAVEMENRVISSIAIDPYCARAVANELLRIVNENKW